MSMTVALLAAEEAAHTELPMPPWMYGAIALIGFAFLLGVTWSFRGTAQKYARPDLEGVRHDRRAAPGPRTSRATSRTGPSTPGHH